MSKPQVSHTLSLLKNSSTTFHLFVYCLILWMSFTFISSNKLVYRTASDFIWTSVTLSLILSCTCPRVREKEAAAQHAAEPADGAPGGAQPPDRTAACCHGGAKMAVLAYSLGKREINQHFTVKNAKSISLVVVILLVVFHTASRYYGGKWGLLLVNVTVYAKQGNTNAS